MVEPDVEAEVTPITRDAVAAAVERLLDDADVSQERGRRGRALVERDHDRRTQVAQLVRLYEELASKRSTASP
jgi:glycosyltransferase involved in cell wall biosynthesis